MTNFKIQGYEVNIKVFLENEEIEEVLRTSQANINPSHDLFERINYQHLIKYDW
jgi:hypothetical protein